MPIDFLGLMMMIQKEEEGSDRMEGIEGIKGIKSMEMNLCGLVLLSLEVLVFRERNQSSEANDASAKCVTADWL